MFQLDYKQRRAYIAWLFAPLIFSICAYLVLPIINIRYYPGGSIADGIGEVLIYFLFILPALSIAFLIWFLSLAIRVITIRNVILSCLLGCFLQILSFFLAMLAMLLSVYRPNPLVYMLADWQTIILSFIHSFYVYVPFLLTQALFTTIVILLSKVKRFSLFQVLFFSLLILLLPIAIFLVIGTAHIKITL